MPEYKVEESTEAPFISCSEATRQGLPLPCLIFVFVNIMCYNN